MRKLLLLLFTTLLLVNSSLVKAQLTATGIDSINVLCNGYNTGYASVGVTGGVMPYTYLWMPGGGNTQIYAGITAGTYTVTVTDNIGNTTSASVTITQPATALSLSGTSGTSATCISDNGTATTNPSGGVGPYTYLWTDPSSQTTQTATGLSAGNYTVTVTDNNGCQISGNTPVGSSSGISLSINPVVDVSCNGGSNGSARVNPSGSIALPYTYLWTPSGKTTQTATGLSAGVYTVTVTDNNGCSSQGTVTITQPPPLTLTVINPVYPVCFGQATGSAKANPGGGTVPYTYSWSTAPIQTTQIATGLSAGSYTVTVKDKNGCTITASISITQPVIVSGTFVNTPVTCNGLSNGSSTVTGTGGTPPYVTYSWNPTAQSTATATGLSAGTYTVTITDNNGCTGTASTTITQPPTLVITSITPTYPLCNGQPGTAIANVSGGTPAYTYSWAPSGGSNATGTGLTAATYTVTVHDNNGCVATASIDITQPPVLTATMGAPTNVLCNGGNNGSATVTAGGGTPAYTYSWSPSGGSNATGTGLLANTYIVTVKDANGCISTASVTITQPPPLTATMGVITYPLCNGGTGTAAVTAGGGTPAYTYAWAASGGSGATGTGLTAGSYTVTVTDNNGCTATASVTITQPTIVSGIFTTTPATCGNSNGSATVTATGGTPPYLTYSWSTIPIQTTTTATGLSAGNYTVTITDNNGCTGTASVAITQPTTLTATMGAITYPPCNGGIGTATVNAAGGTTPYTYLWAPNGGIGATGTGLTAGSYTVTVHDNNGCIATASVAITQPAILTATIGAPTNDLCFGGSNGSATVTAGGGTVPYTYSWAPSGGLGATGTGLIAGSYTVTVKDNNGCIATASVTITQPTIVSGTFTTTGVLCNGGSTGTATVTGTGGTPPYMTYLWNPTAQVTQTAIGLSAGNYTVTITDNAGCTGTASVTITQPLPLTATITGTTNPACNGGTGNSTVSAGGGTVPYTYSWAPSGGTNATGTGLAAGSYVVTVTDNNGCIATASVALTQPTALSSTYASTPENCASLNGTATANPSGGTGPYTYLWTPSGRSTQTATGLSAGTYTVTITDHNGCQLTATVVVGNTSSLSITSTASTNILCNGMNNGSATVNVSGGVTPYTYLWTPSGKTTATATGLSAGTYTINVTDNMGCTQFAVITITQPLTALMVSTSSTASGCSNNTGTATVNTSGGTPAYTYLWSNGATTSNITALGSGTFSVTVTDASGCSTSTTCIVPTSGGVTGFLTSTNVSCLGNNNGTATVNITSGVSPYTYSWNPIGNITPSVTGLSAGSYTVTVHDNNGCVYTAIATITQPASGMSTTLSSTPENCNSRNGTATASPSGGTGPYTYSWNPSAQTTPTATGLASGTYTITITDNNGCQLTATDVVGNTSSLAITSTSSTSLLCKGVNDGTASVTVSGGVSPYTYAWTTAPIQTNSTATGLSAGTYTVNVTDNAGCTQFAVFTITQPAIALSLVTSTAASGCSNNTGSATVTASGGMPAYTYAWSNGATTSNITGLGSGTFTITVTDNNGCSQSTTCIVPTVGGVTGFITSANVSCGGGSNGSASVTITSGTAPYTYLWNPTASTNSSISGLSAGSYSITVHDNNGCLYTAVATITEPTAITTTVSSTPENCASLNGTTTANPSGGTGPYHYVWTPSGKTTQTASGLSSGTYTVTITDNNGCQLTASDIVGNTSSLSITSTSSTNVLCNGVKDGTASVTVGGGVSPYTYAWTTVPIQTNSTATGLSAGSYTINVTDNAGCGQFAVITITQPLTALSLGTSATASGCSNNTGSATVTANGGTPAYTYLWSNGATTSNITGLGSGTFTITVTDNNGCSTSTTCVVPTIGGVTGFLTTTNVSCFGNNVGSATVTMTAGTAPYTYLWAPGGNTTNSLTGLSAGSYSVTVHDINGCLYTAVATITGPASGISAILSSTPDTCGNNDGTATVSASGGSGPYTYSWSPSGQTDTTATGLAAGTYTITITDNSGCSIVQTQVVNNTSSLSITSTSVTGILCYGNVDGSASVIVSGGVSPYTYKWSSIPAQTTDTATGLSAATYTINVTDNAGCTQFAVITITQPIAPISLSTSATASGCSNNTGTATVSASGGTSGYAYLWSNGQTTTNITGLGSGVFTVTVTDANGCSTSTTCVVPTNGGVTGFVATTNTSCFGNNTGTATAFITAGAAPYTYSWTPVVSTNSTLTGLSAGSYTLTVNDANGCIFTAVATVSGPVSPLLASTVTTNSSCNTTNDGTITLTVSGGTPQYTYLWVPGNSTTQNLTNIVSGSYTVIIKDSNGCSLTTSAVVGANKSVLASPGKDTVICTSAASVIALNGLTSTNATTYQWYQMPGMTAIGAGIPVVFVSPPVGVNAYELVVTNGACSDTTHDTIVVAPAFASAGPEQDIFGSGSVTIGGSPTGIIGSSYSWSPGTPSLNDSLLANPTATPTVTTLYTVTVTNSYGCVATDTVTVFVYNGVTVPSGFSPNGDGVNDFWVLPFSGTFPTIIVEVYNRWGELLFHSDGYSQPWDGTYEGKALPIGTYYFVIQLNDPRFPKALTGPVTILR